MSRRLTHWPEVGFLALAAVLAAHRIYDPDFWAHLAAGEQILGAGQVPHTNFFSFTYPDHPWTDVYWLYQITLAALWHQGGSAAVVLLKIFLNITLAAVAVFGLRDRRQPLAGLETAVLLLAWLTIAPRLTDRPELLTLVLLAATLALIRARRLWWCIPLQVIWANLQGLFYLGPLLLLLHAGSEWLAGRRPQARAALPVALIAAAAGMISPFGWRNLLLAHPFWQTVRSLGNQIEELASPFHPAVWSSSGNSWLFVIWMVMGGLLVLRARSMLTTFDRVIMLASLALAVRSQRAVPLAVLCSLPAVLACARTAVSRADRVWRGVAALSMAVLALNFLVGTSWLIRSTRPNRVFGFGVLEDRLPVTAVGKLAKLLQPSDRLGNVHFHTGGYLMWRLNRAAPVLIDGRLEAYPREFVLEYLAAVEQSGRFHQFAEKYGVTHWFVVKDQGGARRLCERLGSSPGWRRVYGDDLAEIFVRVA